jgi:REP element-mobilizing transposase RayT
MLAAHVRTRHVHVVVQAGAAPEAVMTTFKGYASRALNQLGIDGEDRRRWARHGSTRYLWTRDEVFSVIHYVVCEQGAPMAVFEAAT